MPTRKAIWYIVETPIHYVTLHGSARRSFAPLRPCYENRAEFTILMCEQEPIRYGFRAGAKAIWDIVNVALIV